MLDASFRLVAANLFAHRVDLDDLASVLEVLDPDVLAVVELSQGAADVIASRFQYSHLAADEAYSGWGLAARFPVDVDPGRPGWGRGGSARLVMDDLEVHIATVHILDPLHLPLRRTRDIRRSQVEALLEWGRLIPEDSAQLVVGDLNSGPLWPAYRRLAGRWDDLIAGLGTARRTWGVPGGPTLLRLDHILGRGLVAVASDVVPIRGSDHLAVVADLRPA